MPDQKFKRTGDAIQPAIKYEMIVDESFFGEYKGSKTIDADDEKRSFKIYIFQDLQKNLPVYLTGAMLENFEFVAGLRYEIIYTGEETTRTGNKLKSFKVYPIE